MPGICKKYFSLTALDQIVWEPDQYSQAFIQQVKSNEPESINDLHFKKRITFTQITVIQ